MKKYYTTSSYHPPSPAFLSSFPTWTTHNNTNIKQHRYKIPSLRILLCFILLLQLCCILYNYQCVSFSDNPTTTTSTSSEFNSTYHTKTGSFSNCNHDELQQKSNNYFTGIRHNHDDGIIVHSIELDSNMYYSGTIQVACHDITFRISNESFTRGRIKSKIIVGVLSSGASKIKINNNVVEEDDDNDDSGRRRRDSIRQTWANKSKSHNDNYNHNTNNVFFIVGGPWDERIKKEIDTYHDLIWIDEEEVYNGERSVLTLKTYSFLSIVEIMTKKLNIEYTHVFKTDDDSYVDLKALEKELNHNPNRHYIGHCQLEYTKVVRDDTYKWPLSMKTYPEEYFPKYCQGAGYALSRDLVSCSHSKRYIATTRFMPFEDVAVGILAERCSGGKDTYHPSDTQTGEVKVSRYDSMEAKKRTSKGEKQTQDLVPITACMTGRIVQHRVIDEFDMKELHKTVLDPSYCKVTRRRRGKLIKELEKKGITWFG